MEMISPVLTFIMMASARLATLLLTIPLPNSSRQMLHHFVNGKNQAVAVFSGDHLLVLKGHVCTHGVARRDQPSWRAGEVLVIISFQPCKPLAVGSRKSEYGGRETS